MSRRCRRTEYADRGGLWPAHRRDSADLLIRRARTRNRVLAHSTDRPGCNRHSARKGVPTEIRPGRRHCRTFRGKGANGPAVPCVTRELCDSTSARLFLACGRCRPLIQNKCPRRCAIMSRAAGPPCQFLTITNAGAAAAWALCLCRPSAGLAQIPTPTTSAVANSAVIQISRCVIRTDFRGVSFMARFQGRIRATANGRSLPPSGSAPSRWSGWRG